MPSALQSSCPHQWPRQPTLHRCLVTPRLRMQGSIPRPCRHIRPQLRATHPRILSLHPPPTQGTQRLLQLRRSTQVYVRLLPHCSTCSTHIAAPDLHISCARVEAFGWSASSGHSFAFGISGKCKMLHCFPLVVASSVQSVRICNHSEVALSCISNSTQHCNLCPTRCGSVPTN